MKDKTQKSAVSREKPTYQLPTENQLKTSDERAQKESAKYFMHKNVKTLAEDFLAEKQKNGSQKEKKLYKGMSVEQLLERFATKRPLAFHGGEDNTLLRDGTELTGNNSNAVTEMFLQIGTDNEKEPLVLSEYLSYDEMQLSALLCSSAKTSFINNGERHNAANPGGFELHILDAFDPQTTKLPESSYHTYIIVNPNPKNNFPGEVYFIDKSDPKNHTITKLELQNGKDIAALKKDLNTGSKNFIATLSKKQSDNIKLATNHNPPSAEGTFHREGYYLGLVGARFEKSDVSGLRAGLNEYAHLVISPTQNTKKNGYGKNNTSKKAKAMRPFAKFYKQSHFPTYEEAKESVEKDPNSPYIKLEKQDLTSNTPDIYFNLAAYKIRMKAALEAALEEMNGLPEKDQQAYGHFVGLGSGAWSNIPIPNDLPINCQALFEITQIEIIGELLKQNKYPNIGVLNFSWFSDKARQKIEELAKNNQGIEILHSKRNVADPLPEKHKDKLLVGIYAWDGNSAPGNEYHRQRLTDSGDPAAASCSTITETQDPHKNSILMQKLKAGTAVEFHGTLTNFSEQKTEKFRLKNVFKAIASVFAPKEAMPSNPQLDAVQKHLRGNWKLSKNGDIVVKVDLTKNTAFEWKDKVSALNMALGKTENNYIKIHVIESRDIYGNKRLSITIPKDDVDKIKNNEKIQDKEFSDRLPLAVKKVELRNEAIKLEAQFNHIVNDSILKEDKKIEKLQDIEKKIQRITADKDAPQKTKDLCAKLTQNISDVAKTINVPLPKAPVIPPSVSTPVSSPVVSHDNKNGPHP